MIFRILYKSSKYSFFQCMITNNPMIFKIYINSYLIYCQNFDIITCEKSRCPREKNGNKTASAAKECAC